LGRVKLGDDPYGLKRLPVNSWDDEALLRAKVEGGYDWLAVPQKAFKKLKASFRPSSRPLRFQRRRLSQEHAAARLSP